MGKRLSEVKEERGIGGPPMLRGQDLPKGTREVKIKVKEFRLAPDNFKSPAIIDLEKEVHGRASWAVNVTNIRALAEKFGLGQDPDLDDLAKALKGKTITLTMAMVNNPQQKKLVPSLFVA